MIDILLTIVLNALPLLILIIPLFFMWKKYVGKVYFRILVGIIVFFLIYWILPIIFQAGSTPDNLKISGSSDFVLGIKYILAHIGSLAALYSFYPLVTLPFIFFVAPFISVLFVWNQLRKEPGSFKENLKHITYEYSEGPYEKIKNEVLKNDWSREKQILKLMIVLLPISLYLLQVIIDISNLQNISLTTGETALGWFIEILFVYLAVFIFSIELLFSSRIALKGKYFGEDIREQIYKSLYTVGAPISILSIILFLIQYTASIFVIIYFFAYFIMASIIFVLFLKVFEPISILIFLKLINWCKNRGERISKIKKTNWYYMIVTASLVFLVFFILNIFAFVPIFRMFGEDQATIISSASYSHNDPTLINAYRFDLMNIFNTVVLVIVPLFLSAYAMAYTLRFVKSVFLGIILYLAILILFSILIMFIGGNPLINFAPEEYWLTGKISYTNAFGIPFYISRTAAFNANLFPKGQITLLGILAFPYLFTRYLFNIVIWGLMLFYIGKDFKVKNVPINDKNIQRTIFSSITEFISYEEYLRPVKPHMITKKETISIEGPELQKELVINLINQLDGEPLLRDVKPDDMEKKKKLYFALKFLYDNNQIRIWNYEFSYTEEKVEKQGLYIIYTDGRDVFSYAFDKNSDQDAGLISGMFTAITSFVKETTKSTQLLKTIDHGDITIMIEYGEYVFAALFMKGNSAEVRAQLREFVNRFENKHDEVLPKWNGALAHFKQDDELVKDIFTED
ncbi:MAG: hypothetical protein GF383_06450 [Candidatus Lokiarchaeota archaeon]|nr:hypothetical protein [Candidatus Lokiarchaeota archaeon]MBD3339695.1 hypothetical protein [Candidatus Lokiarchaeota archaeon]